MVKYTDMKVAKKMFQKGILVGVTRTTLLSEKSQRE